MKLIHQKINFDVKELAREELPLTHLLYDKEKQLWSDLNELFEFPRDNQKNMPFYVVDVATAEKTAGVFGEVYNMLMEALFYVFKEDMSVIKKFFGQDFMSRHPYFFEYAKETFKRKHPALYGRFDAAFDPETNEVKAIYEFNGDTPVMLFESVILENNLSCQVVDTGFAQSNYYYEMLSDFVAKMKPRQAFAVLCDTDYVEDMVACETFAQIFNSKGMCLFDNIKNIQHDFTVKSGSPFFVSDINVSDIFLLCPWEEMVEAQPEFFKNWKSWVNDVNFYEPAWRWFISNKGIWAYITDLCMHNPTFYAKYKHLPILPTFMDNSEFLKSGAPYVQKPLIGRLSMNVRLYDGQENGNALVYESEGVYAEEQCIYQTYMPPYKLPERAHFIMCYWMAPVLDEFGQAKGMNAEPATLAFREFDGVVTVISTERFIPHLVLDY